MKNVTITEAVGFMPGGVQQMLINMGVQAQVASAPGESPVVYKAQMTEPQIEHFRLRGFSHRLDVEETPVVDPRDASIASLQAGLQERDEHIASLQRILQEQLAKVGVLEGTGKGQPESSINGTVESLKQQLAKDTEVIADLQENLSAAHLLIGNLQTQLAEERSKTPPATQTA